MPKTRTTLALDDDVLRSLRVAAARWGVHDSEVVENALRSYLGWGAIGEIQSRFNLTEEEADAIVEAEVYAPRAERRAARRP